MGFLKFKNKIQGHEIVRELRNFRKFSKIWAIYGNGSIPIRLYDLKSTNAMVKGCDDPCLQSPLDLEYLTDNLNKTSGLYIHMFDLQTNVLIS